MSYPTLVDNVANNKLATSLTAGTYAADTDGDTVSLEGFNSATFMYAPGTVAAGTAPLPEESADGTTWNAIAAEDLIGTLADLVSDTDVRFGYRGGHSYVRASVTASGAGGPLFSGVLLGNPNHGAIDGNTNPIIT